MPDLRARLAAATGFEWDAGNDTKSWTKRQVTRGECEQPFFNTPLLVAEDPAHSTLESRYLALGKTNAGRRLFIVFTLRGPLIRVISARPMSRHDRESYQRAEEEEFAE